MEKKPRALEEESPTQRELKENFPIVNDHGKVVTTEEYPMTKTPLRGGELDIFSLLFGACFL